MKNMGLNFMKTMYPIDQSLLDACDEKGIMCWIKIPIMDKASPSKEFFESSITMLNEMVLQSYHHPAIVVWGSECEILGDMDWFWPKPLDKDLAENHVKFAYNFTKKMREHILSLDSTRFVANDFHTDPTPEYYKSGGFTDLHDFNGWNIYQGWYHNNLDSIGPSFDKFRAYNLEKPFAIAESGAGSDNRIHTYKPTLFDHSVEYQQILHKRFHQEVKKRPWVAMHEIWVFNDFQREGRDDVLPHINPKGMTTSDRQIKDIYYYFQSIWTTIPMVRLAAKEWNYRIEFGKDTIIRPFKAYSNCQEVELLCNGVSLGKQKPNDGEASWSVSLRNGKNNVQVIGTAKNNTIKDEAEIEAVILNPELSKNKLPDLMLCINVGQSRTFFRDPVDKTYWLHDKEYSKGNYGHKNGHYHRTWTSMPAYQDIREGVSAAIKGSNNDPIFQTFLVGVTDYQIDVSAGEYLVELLFAEPFSKQDRLKPSEQTGADEDGNRVFSVLVNNQLFCENLNLAEQVGEQRAHTVSAKVSSTNGINIQLKPVKGQPVLSGIKVRKL